MTKYLGIVGPSGSGKTTAMDKLIEAFPETFVRVDQATTREIRDDEPGNAYVWLDSRRDYRKIQHLLIAKTESSGGHLYGSIPLPKGEKRIGIVILNELGLLDLQEHCKSVGRGLYVIGLDAEDLKTIRFDRDENFIKQERKVLEYADHVFVKEKDGNYITPQEMYEVLKEFIEK